MPSAASALAELRRQLIAVNVAIAASTGGRVPPAASALAELKRQLVAINLAIADFGRIESHVRSR